MADTMVATYAVAAPLPHVDGDVRVRVRYPKWESTFVITKRHHELLRATNPPIVGGETAHVRYNDFEKMTVTDTNVADEDDEPVPEWLKFLPCETHIMLRQGNLICLLPRADFNKVKSAEAGVPRKDIIACFDGCRYGQQENIVHAVSSWPKSNGELLSIHHLFSTHPFLEDMFDLGLDVLLSMVRHPTRRIVIERTSCGGITRNGADEAMGRLLDLFSNAQALAEAKSMHAE